MSSVASRGVRAGPRILFLRCLGRRSRRSGWPRMPGRGRGRAARRLEKVSGAPSWKRTLFVTRTPPHHHPAAPPAATHKKKKSIGLGDEVLVWLKYSHKHLHTGAGEWLDAKVLRIDESLGLYCIGRSGMFCIWVVVEQLHGSSRWPPRQPPPRSSPRTPPSSPTSTRRSFTISLSSNIVTCIVTLVHNRHFELRKLARPRRALLCLGRPLAPAAGGAAWPIGALAAGLAARPTTTTPPDRR